MSEKMLGWFKSYRNLRESAGLLFITFLKKKYEFRWIQLDGGKYRILRRVSMTA